MAINLPRGNVWYMPLAPHSVYLLCLDGKVAHISRRPYTDKVRVVFTGKVVADTFGVTLPDGTITYIHIEEALT